MIVVYRLVAGLWQALGVASVTPPSPPGTVGYGVGGYGSQPYGS